jgi:hypothetical protein
VSTLPRFSSRSRNHRHRSSVLRVTKKLSEDVLHLGVQFWYPRDKGVGLMSARAELARLVLQMLASGNVVPISDALQLRNWAVTPEDAMLTLKEVALRILIEEHRKPRSA